MKQRGEYILRFSKRLLYAIIMIAFCSFTVAPRIWYALTYKQTKGVVQYFGFTESYGGRSGKIVRTYPLVYFAIGRDSFSIYGSRFQREAVEIGDTVPVIYNSSVPARAYVYDFTGFWSPVIVYFIPFTLVITLIFGLDTIPKIITIRF